MPKIILITTVLLGIVALGVWIIPQPAAQEEPTDVKTVDFQVSGMTCSGCEVGVKTVVKKLDGIHKVLASYSDGKALVTYDPSKVKPEEIQAAIETLGYKAEPEKAKGKEPTT